MRGTAGKSTAVLRSNNANSSLTIGVKKENMNKRIGSVQFDRKVLRNPALHIAKPFRRNASQAVPRLRPMPGGCYAHPFEPQTIANIRPKLRILRKHRHSLGTLCLMQK
jgi:hypothetical protein